MADVPSMTDLRRRLLAESNAFDQRSKFYLQAIESPTTTFADFDAHEGLASAGVYAWLLATVLHRVVEEKPNVEEILAYIVSSALDGDLDWRGLANGGIGDSSAGVS